MVSRTFHVLFVPDGLVASCIDAIRVLSNPGEKHRAHITVRGPYPSSRNQFGHYNRIVAGSEIKISGSGNFFDSGQNTVYLQCESPKLKDVWDKPDYGFNPHITLYDGSSYDFSRMLWEIVASRTYDISFIAGPLTPLVSSRRGQGGLALQADLDHKLLRDVADLNTDEANVESLGQDERLKAIDKLCDFLATIETNRTSIQSQERSHEDKGTEIRLVDINSRILVEIKALAKKNSSTLGFLPEGAFDAYAQSGWILAAIIEDKLVGYVIYRESRMRAVLVHLCTDDRYRGRGIARELFRSVAARTNGLRGILVNSRRDFPAHSMWPHLGFTAIGERPGRGKKQTVLTHWWYEHPHPTLFSTTALGIDTQSPIDVAMDLNVFYDLVLPSSGDGSDESRSLQGDWLADEIQLCVTGELFNEIDRLPGPQARKKQRDQAHEFKRISGTVEAFDKAYSLLSSIMGESKGNRKSSDLRHLAHTAAAGVEYFATRDAKILKHWSDIEGATGVTPISPADLVIHLDQIRNTASYQPVRLRGSTLQIRKVERRQREELEKIFPSRSLGEKKAEFKRKLSAILASPTSVDSRVILEDGEPIAIFGIDRSNQNILTIPCLRLRHGLLARTLARQIATLAIDSSIANNYSMTAVTDDWMESHTEEALSECGFIKDGSQWLKLNYRAIGTEDDVSSGLAGLLEQARDYGFELPGTQSFPLQTECQLTATDTVLVEKALRPLKITNDSLDTVVIPVQPRWAQHLFDSSLAEQTLFGARPDLMLNWENAYYRAPRSMGNISVPFRILWYVSQDDRYTGTGQIRAYSVGSSVDVIPAHTAYNRYKRLGVYDWQQILRVSGGDPNDSVMVIRFCDIEVFNNPIDRSKFSELLNRSDQKKPSLRGPQQISETAFAAIYGEGQS